jgi:hypothetical protein
MAQGCCKQKMSALYRGVVFRQNLSENAFLIKYFGVADRAVVDWPEEKIARNLTAIQSAVSNQFN